MRIRLAQAASNSGWFNVMTERIGPSRVSASLASMPQPLQFGRPSLMKAVHERVRTGEEAEIRGAGRAGTIGCKGQAAGAPQRLPVITASRRFRGASPPTRSADWPRIDGRFECCRADPALRRLDRVTRNLARHVSLHVKPAFRSHVIFSVIRMQHPD